MFWILGQILFYYCWSISITFFNKWCFSVSPILERLILIFNRPELNLYACAMHLIRLYYLDHNTSLPQNFHFPLIVSFLHMTIVSHVIWLYRTVTKGTAKKDDITWTLYAKRVCPTGKLLVDFQFFKVSFPKFGLWNCTS